MCRNVPKAPATSCSDFPGCQITIHKIDQSNTGNLVSKASNGVWVWLSKVTNSENSFNSNG